MILEEETFEAFGYYPSNLKPKSNKPVLAACNECRKIRTIRKYNYRVLCRSCAKKGEKNSNYDKHLTEEHKAKISASRKGHKVTDKTKSKMSIVMKGNNNPNLKGGRKVAKARAHAKRDRQLDYILLMPLTPGEVGHHVTDEYIIGIPAEIHQHFTGYRRKKHRALILQWLKETDKTKYNLVLNVLCNNSYLNR